VDRETASPRTLIDRGVFREACDALFERLDEVGLGRIAVPETEAPNLFTDLV
jgi:hypothetical protein